MKFEEWCKEHGYDFSVAKWHMQLHDAYLCAYLLALTEYIEWRCDRARI